MAEPETRCWTLLAPPLQQGSGEAEILSGFVADLLAAQDERSELRVEERTSSVLGGLSETQREGVLGVCVSLVADLATQGWDLRVSGGRIEVAMPQRAKGGQQAEKARIRAQELVKREEQLGDPATRRFISQMEQRRFFGSGFVSIFSLMRDGRELAAGLRAAAALPEKERAAALKQAVDPYVQVVSDGAVCEHTGLRLQDIWRYFRHTWSNQYVSTPGRTMGFLVRDRAAPTHPVVGIGALGSPIVQIRERDTWIGWHPEHFLEVLEESPSDRLARWLVSTIDTAISEIYTEDFLAEDFEGAPLVSPGDTRRPEQVLSDRLRRYGSQQKELHHRLTQSGELKRARRGTSAEDSAAHWLERAQSHLFRSKRASALAEYLDSRRVIQAAMGMEPSAAGLAALVRDRSGRAVIKRVIRKAKADRVGIAMADITVCGAVPPYNPILGGKLVSLLAASPEIAQAYQERYSNQESEIASSMAGRPIVRPSSLVLLGTTSLYGASSQYNRVRMPAERIGGSSDEELRFWELGRSQGWGTSHLSERTVQGLVRLVQQSSGGQRVSSTFGEGVSPKLRKIRDGLDLLRLPSDRLLQHGRRRIVYGIPLIRNLREYLLGLDSAPDYLFEAEGPEATEAVARWWAERWLLRRVEREQVLQAVEQHTLVRPIRHGARVELPPESGPQQGLFDDLY